MQKSLYVLSRQIITALISVRIGDLSIVQSLTRIIDDEIRQCLLYDSDGPSARLIGIEYMITPQLYETLPAEERRLWHSHVFEVKSGLLIMPNQNVPDSIWRAAETREMEQVVELYGKAYHLWQTDRGDKLPIGEPQLMTSFTDKSQFDFSKHVTSRDRRFNVDYRDKARAREHIEEPDIHPGKAFPECVLSGLTDCQTRIEPGSRTVDKRQINEPKPCLRRAGTKSDLSFIC